MANAGISIYFHLFSRKTKGENWSMHKAGPLWWFHSDYDFILTCRCSAIILNAKTKPWKALIFYQCSSFARLHWTISLCLSVVVAGWRASEVRWESQRECVWGEWTWRTVAGTGSSGCGRGPGAGRQRGASGNLLRLSSCMPVHMPSGTNKATS